MLQGPDQPFPEIILQPGVAGRGATQSCQKNESNRSCWYEYISKARKTL